MFVWGDGGEIWGSGDGGFSPGSYHAWHAEGAASPPSPIDTRFLGSGTYRRITEYQNLAQGVEYTNTSLLNACMNE